LAAGKAELVIVTGLSGSGKSTVAKCFEDLGYYVVDNLPLPLLREFLDRPLALVGDAERNIALITDVRATGFAAEFPSIFRGLDRTQTRVTLLFLEASEESLMRRFSETRRPHPLSKDLPVLEAIQREREMLDELRGLADLVFDTSQWNVHEIRSKVNHAFAPQAQGTEMQVSLVSFGFKYGIPTGSDLLFDVRFLPNPHFVAELRPLSGRDSPVLAYLDQQPDFVELVERLSELLIYLLPRYRRENRSYLSVAVGCTGGRHRSVAIVESLGKRLREAGWEPKLRHRDMDR
jgi:RNase adapter protein RapZ